MHYYEVAPTQIVRTKSATFTYASQQKLRQGQIVTIEIGKKAMVGIVMSETSKPTYDTKQVASLLDEPPLPPQLIRLAQWLSDYYSTHLALTLQSILPRGIQKNRRARTKSATPSVRQRTQIVLTRQQQQALATIEDMSPGTALIHGVTGSGKTQIYIELARQCIEAGKSAIILVPEIALTSQLVDEFSHHFSDIILTHSRQTEAERHAAWRDALSSTTPRVAIGPRSALFLPLRSVGLIAIDEAHEPSFKQEQSPRYSAQRAASMLAQFHTAKLILGSATPSIADYYIAKHAARPVIKMSSLARTDAIKPTVELVDMTKRAGFKRHRFLSDALLKRLEETINSGNQALIFHNRRGSASSTLCENCGWSAMCARCFVPTTLHADQHHLRCHICGLIERVPTSCPECYSADIIHKGIGTKLIETELHKFFPNKKIVRFDGDTHSSDTVESRYKELYDGEIDIIIGTQVIAKGLDLPKLRTVGVVQADAGLSLPDYTSSERTFQLLSQVIGRVGRSHHETTVVVQSYQPTHPAVIDGLSQDYQHFYLTTLIERERSLFPPFTFLLKLTCIYKTERAAVSNAKKLAVALRALGYNDVQILGPTPSFYERQGDTYRWQLVIKSPHRTRLVSLLEHVPATHWQFELDPGSLL